MCLIVDANRMHSFANPRCPDGGPLLALIRNRKSKLVIGGKISTELLRAGCGKLLAELDRAGMCIRVQENALANTSSSLEDQRRMRSNDHHIIAAAKLSGARLLYSHDDALIADFKCSELLTNPRGKVYKSKRNASVLASSKCADHC